MAVNGKGDNDPTKWNVLGLDGKPLEAKQGKEKKVSKLTGLPAKEAFGFVRQFRGQGVTATAVRT